MKLTSAHHFVPKRGRVLGTGLFTVLVGVLAIHRGAALAQQPVQGPAVQAPTEAAPQYQQEPQQYPPGYGPPPGYGSAPTYGPPRGYGASPPAYSAPPPRYSYYPPPPPPPSRASAIDRPFLLGGSLGIGVMGFHDLDNVATSGPATGFSGRLGFGVAPRVLLLLGVDGAVSVADNFVYNQNIYYIGAQFFLTEKLFLRGGGGIGNITGQSSDYGDFLSFGKTGPALTGSLGIELLQGYNWSLELAGQFLAGFYKDERWSSGTLQIGFNFF